MFELCVKFRLLQIIYSASPIQLRDCTQYFGVSSNEEYNVLREASFQPKIGWLLSLRLNPLKMSTNYSLYAIPVGWAFAIAPHFYAVSLTSGKDFKTEFNNVSPRDYLSLVRAQEKQSPVRSPSSSVNRSRTDDSRGWDDRLSKSTCELNLPTPMDSRTSVSVSHRIYTLCEEELTKLRIVAASVAIGNFAGVPTDQMNALAIGYLALRALYSVRASLPAKIRNSSSEFWS